MIIYYGASQNRGNIILSGKVLKCDVERIYDILANQKIKSFDVKAWIGNLFLDKTTPNKKLL